MDEEDLLCTESMDEEDLLCTQSMDEEDLLCPEKTSTVADTQRAHEVSIGREPAPNCGENTIISKQYLYTMTQAIEIVFRRSDPPKAATAFTSQSPIGDFWTYVKRCHRYLKFDKSTYVLSGIYINRMLLSRRVQLGYMDLHRLFAVSLLVADKFNSDNNFTAQHMSKVLGLSYQELNSLEYALLLYLSFNVHVSSEEYHVWDLAITEGLATTNG